MESDTEAMGGLTEANPAGRLQEFFDRVPQLISRFATTKPSVMAAEATDLLNEMARATALPMYQVERSRLRIETAEVASVTAWSATLDDRPGEAAAYFALASNYADLPGLDFLKGATLASEARMDRPIAGDDPCVTLRKLAIAVPLLGDSGMAQWATFLEAEAYASLRRSYECKTALERASAMVPRGPGDGFFSSAGLLSDLNAEGAAHDRWAAVCYAYLGRAEDAIGHITRALLGEYRDVREPVAVSADAALVYTVAYEPEAACEHAVRALTGAQETGYRAGVVRVRRVRGCMPEAWAPLAYVRDLDERLRFAF